MNPTAPLASIDRAGPKAATMRAAVIVDPRRVDFVDLPIPRPGPSQVCLRLEGCGVCASNVPLWEGRPWFQYPLPPGAPGHEGWGTVHSVGSQVRGLRMGDRVACISGNAFATHDLADADAVVRLPDELSQTPVLGEPLGCAVNIFRRAEIAPGQRVAIVGIGFLGALLVQLARQAGAEVVAISRRSSSLEFASDCGAKQIVCWNQAEQQSDQVMEALDWQEFPRVIEATGTQAGLNLASRLTAVRGRLIIAGYHQDGQRTVDMQQWNWRGIDVINAHERDPAVYREGMEIAITQVQSGALNLQPLLTHCCPLNELSAALEIAARRPEGFMKCYVTCQ